MATSRLLKKELGFLASGCFPEKSHSLSAIKLSRINHLMKNFLLLGLALLAVGVMLYAGLNGIMKDHSYGFFFTFTGALTSIGLGMDVVNHLKVRVRKSTVRKLGRY